MIEHVEPPETDQSEDEYIKRYEDYYASYTDIQD